MITDVIVKNKDKNSTICQPSERSCLGTKNSFEKWHIISYLCYLLQCLDVTYLMFVQLS